MNPMNDEIDERLQTLLKQLKPAAPLDPATAAAERARFMAQVNHLAKGVSLRPESRLTGWIKKITTPSRRKELSPMFSTLLTIALVIGVLFGGAGTTVYAAQNSLPDYTLYPVKTWSEQVRIRLTNSPEDQLGMVLQFTNRRMLELSEIVSQDDTIPLVWQTRFQQNLEDALQIAAGMDDPSLQQALAQIRSQAENQVQNILTLRREHPGLADQLMDQLQERLREQARLAGLGETDPQGFRQQIHDRDRLHWQTTPFPGSSATRTQTSTCTPAGTQNSFGPGPNAGTTAGTQSQFGPGGSTYNQTPEPSGNGYGPGLQAGDPTKTPVTGGSGTVPGPVNPTATPKASGGGSGSGSGQPTATSQPSSGGQGSGSGQPTATAQQNGQPTGGGATQPPGGNSKP